MSLAPGHEQGRGSGNGARLMETKCQIACGLCCENLYLWDKFLISLHTKSLMVSTRCNFLTPERHCSIYATRPKLCREWICGAVAQSLGLVNR